LRHCDLAEIPRRRLLPLEMTDDDPNAPLLTDAAMQRLDGKGSQRQGVLQAGLK